MSYALPRPSSKRVFRIWTGALTALVLTATAACSPVKERADAGEAVSPTFYSSVLAVCDLLKKPDLEAATGLRYRDGADLPTFAFGTLTGVTKCVYRPEGRFGPGRAPVVGAVVYSYADEVLAAQKPLFEKIGIEQVSGVGDEAFWVPAANELYSLVDEKILGMHVPASGFEPDEDLKERSRRLALKAIERLR